MPEVVISASRRTDIPAFYMPWFMDCVRRGRFEVINPYNRQTYVVPATPDRVHSIVFWSKNFAPFIDRHDGETLQDMGYHLFFNFTINTPNPQLEPMMPPLTDRLSQLEQLAARFGPKCIQWRFDPICHFREPSGQVSHNLSSFKTIARAASNAGVSICITSFADLYRKVLQRMMRHSDLEPIALPMDQKLEMISKLANLLSGKGIELKLCCETEVLAALPAGVSATAAACIPNDRLIQLYGPGISLAKDSGQRRSRGCTCSVSKDIGSYNLHPCRHDCLYCYANPEMDRK